MRIGIVVTVATLALARDSTAQSASVMAQAIPLVTRADPTATRAALTEGYLSQPVIMAHADWGILRGIGALNLEGLTLQRGELTTGGYGEGYVDRRHPHAYVHELLVGGELDRGSRAASVFVGRGFAPFGSDDPMMRPLEKYPVNHHLAQVLERIVAVGAIRAGALIGEIATFNGDEPLGPGSPPNFDRFGDSWSTRVTALPLDGLELSGSYANVKSPEARDARGLDQRKSSVVARFDRTSAASRRYALVEWARTIEHDRGVATTRLSTYLAEGAYCRSGVILAGRLERTDRPEEERLIDPFRVSHPGTDLSNIGVSRWTTFTTSVSAPRLSWGMVSGRPFVEVARIAAGSGDPPGLFDATLVYGTNRMWMLSAGIRLRAGSSHDRMGRYGAALPMQAMHMMPMMPMMHGDMPMHDMTSNARCTQ
jgi:hypothetical protein